VSGGGLKWVTYGGSISLHFPLLDASDPPDPNLVSVDDVSSFQLEHWANPLGGYLMQETAIDLDDNGVAGTVLPNGEFYVLLPELAHSVTITATLDAPEDTRDLWRGDFPDFSPLDMASECKKMASSIEALPSAILQEELIREQSADPDCQKWLDDARETKGRLFDIDPDGLLVRIAPLDQYRQTVVPLALQPRLLHLEHFPVSAGHPGVSRIIQSLRRRFFWPKWP
jgi:Integrase zinc binding domain